MRAHDRREQQLLAIIADLSDRLMFLVGRTWVPSPAELEEARHHIDDPGLNEEEEFVTDAELIVD